jgi:hypothetical protein
MDRARSGYLQAGRQPQAWTTNTISMSDSQLNMTTSGHVSVPADSYLAAKDGSMEIVLNKESDTDNTLVLQERGFLETDPAEHDEDTRWDVSPVWPDIVLFNALEAVIGTLYGYGLYAKGQYNDATYPSTGLVELPEGAKDAFTTIYNLNGTRWMGLQKGRHFEVLHNAGEDVDSPPQLQFYAGGVVGGDLRIPYKRDFLLPSAVFATDQALVSPTLDWVTEVDLEDCLIPTSLQPHLSMAVASYVLQGRDVPLLDNQRVKEALANAGIQPGTRSGVARSLLSTFVSVHLAAERNRLLEASPTTITYSPVGG